MGIHEPELDVAAAAMVGFKRLADRPRDRNDLLGLAEIHGELPHERIPGLYNAHYKAR